MFLNICTIKIKILTQNSSHVKNGTKTPRMGNLYPLDNLFTIDIHSGEEKQKPAQKDHIWLVAIL